jgi:hypothetical protein
MAQDGSGPASCPTRKTRQYGEQGNDTMRGYSGNDVLIGGRGSDAAFGAGGSDQCVAEKRLRCER